MRIKFLFHVEHHGARRAGSEAVLPDREAQQLIKKGLAQRLDNAKGKSRATGAKPSASPAAPASRKRTSTGSGAGATPATTDLLS